MIDDFLGAGGIPPFGGEVVLAASNEDPEWFRKLNPAEDGRRGALAFGEVNVAAKPGQRQADVQPLFQVLAITVQEMVGALVALVDERIVHGQDFDALLPAAKGRE